MLLKTSECFLFFQCFTSNFLFLFFLLSGAKFNKLTNIKIYLIFPFLEFFVCYSVFWNSPALYFVKSKPYNPSFLTIKDWDYNFTKKWDLRHCSFPKNFISYYVVHILLRPLFWLWPKSMSTHKCKSFNFEVVIR